MSVELGRRLLASGLISRENVRDALVVSEQRGISFPRALVECGIVSEAALDDEIARLAGPGLRYVQGSIELVTKLVRGLPRRLSALPTRIDPATGIIDIAAADPFDPHVESEMAFQLNARVRVLRASIGAVEEAIRRIEIAASEAREEPRNRVRRMTPALPYGAPDSIPPPAASTPIPLVKRASPDSVSAFDASDLNVEDTYTDDGDDLSRTAGWGSLPKDRPAPGLSGTLDYEKSPPAESDESASLGRTAAWGSPATARAAVAHHDSEPDETAALGRTAGWGTPVATNVAVPIDEPELDESASLGRTAAWGAPVAAQVVAPKDEPEFDESAALGRTAAWGSPVTARAAVQKRDPEPDESASLGRTAGWVSPGRVGAPTSAATPSGLSRTLGFEEEAPRVSFPSTAPPGLESVPPPLGFAPPELSAWKGLSSPKAPSDAVVEDLTSNEVRTNSNIPDVDVETTYVSPPEELPGPTTQSSPLDHAVRPQGPAADEEFDDEPRRLTLTEFPPPTSMVDVKSLIASLATAKSRDDIVDVTFQCLSLFARRAALFAVKRDGYYGWMCNDAFGSPEALRQIVIPNNLPSVMATAAATSIYLGPIPRTPAHDKLLAIMKDASRDVAVASVRVGGKVAAVLIADELRDTLSGTRRMDELARAMGDALTRLVKSRG